MDDDGGDWFADAGDEPAAPQTPAAASQPQTPATPGTASTVEGDPLAADVPQEEAPPAEAEYLDPDKLLLFKHWIRPKFLQYHYLYNYRRNYYDDVIDYLDKRQRGLGRDIPRAQTWAERALRTYTSNSKREEYFDKVAEDIKLVTSTHLSGEFTRYHSRQLVNRRFTSLLY